MSDKQDDGMLELWANMLGSGEGEEGEEGELMFGEEEGDLMFGDGDDLMFGEGDDMMFCEDEDGEDFDMNAAFLEVAKAESKGPSNNTIPECFRGRDFYEILDIDRGATAEQINKAYKKQSLKHHPDRNQSNPEATNEFAYLAKIHETLAKDPRKREMYDLHGDVGSDMSTDFMDAYAYWQQLFPNVTPSDTEAFKANYLDSDEERVDVVNFFNEAKGDFFMMVKELFFFSEPDTVDRDAEIVESLIAEKKITNKAYIETFRKTRKTAKKQLEEFIAEEERIHNELTAEARRKATVKGRVNERLAEVILQQLIASRNRAQDKNLVDNVAAKFLEQDIAAASALQKKRKGADQKSTVNKKKK